MSQKFINNFSSTVSQTFGATDTYLYLTSVVGLPVLTGGDYLLLTLFRKVGAQESGHEVVKVTAITDNMLTVVRSIEGAAGSVFNVGSLVEARVTAKSLTDLAEDTILDAHTNNTSNPHTVTAAQVGLGNVNNTSDASKPVSTEQAAAIAAVVYTHPANHAASVITQDASNRFVTDAEKTTWNAKGSGDVTLTGTQTLTNKTITGITETVYNLAGTVITEANGSIQTKTLSANTTFTETLTDGQSVILGITSGSYTVTWPSVTWAKVGGSGVAPTLTSTGVNWIVLWKVSSVLRGSFLGTA